MSRLETTGWLHGAIEEEAARREQSKLHAFKQKYALAAAEVLFDHAGSKVEVKPTPVTGRHRVFTKSGMTFKRIETSGLLFSIKSVPNNDLGLHHSYAQLVHEHEATYTRRPLPLSLGSIALSNKPSFEYGILFLNHIVGDRNKENLVDLGSVSPRAYVLENPDYIPKAEHHIEALDSFITSLGQIATADDSLELPQPRQI